jgi:hypothetical protein
MTRDYMTFPGAALPPTPNGQRLNGDSRPDSVNRWKNMLTSDEPGPDIEESLVRERRRRRYR